MDRGTRSFELSGTPHVDICVCGVDFRDLVSVDQTVNLRREAVFILPVNLLSTLIVTPEGRRVPLH